MMQCRAVFPCCLTLFLMKVLTFCQKRFVLLSEHFICKGLITATCLWSLKLLVGLLVTVVLFASEHNDGSRCFCAVGI